MAIFSSVASRVIKRHILETCDKNTPFLPFVYSMCRYYGSLRHISQMKYARFQTTFTPSLFWMFHDQTQINVKYYSQGKNSNRNFYNVLGVTPQATQSQIKTAYYTLSKEHHPDTKTGDKENVIFLEINEAYEVLGNIKKRRLYDRGVLIPNLHHNVRDYKHEHEEEGPESGFQSPINEKPKKHKVYTGRSKIYNFDEHYRQHYSSLFERKMRADQNIRRREQYIKDTRLENQASYTALVTFFIFGIIAYFMSS